MKLSRIDHVALSVKDAVKSKDFYSRILGLPEISRPNFSFPGIWYKLGDIMIHIIQQPDQPSMLIGRNCPHRTPMLLFFVDNEEELQKVIQKVESENIPWYELENAPSGLRQVFFKDPDGHMIEIVTPNPASPYYESVYLKYYV